MFEFSFIRNKFTRLIATFQNINNDGDDDDEYDNISLKTI
jgi:hypothetical protein